MADFYKPYEERTPDSQYRDRLQYILDHGIMINDTPQGVGALTCFGTLPQMVFDLSNGAPVITDRSMKSFWKKAVIEILAFSQGVRDIDTLIELGCNYWKDYIGKGTKHGLEPSDLGPGSYGGAFHDFPMPDGDRFDQYAAVIKQIRERPDLRTHFISPWIPYYTFRGPDKKVVVNPCHGWQLYRVIGGTLNLTMWQRSADFPIGVPSNMAQYTAMLILMAHLAGLKPGTFVHQFGDAHIYENQIENVQRLLEREPRRLPTLTLASGVTDFFKASADDFELSDYDPHPPISIPYIP